MIADNFEFSIRMIADKYDRLEDCMVSYDYDKHTISYCDMMVHLGMWMRYLLLNELCST